MIEGESNTKGEKMSEAKENPGYVDENYLKMAENFTRHVKQRSYELMQIQQGQKVLDVGCGPATDTISLAHLVGSDGLVLGVDYDEGMIIEANHKAKEAAVAEWTRHKQGDATALPFEDGYFDSCRSERMFQHLVNPKQVLSEMTRVTKLDGWIVVVDTDQGAVVIDTPETEIERRLMRFYVEETFNNGYAGRQLYRMFKQQGLLDLTIELFGIPITSYAIMRQASRLDMVEKLAVEAGVITLDELERWRISLEQADSMGVFFGSIPQVMIAGRKP